VKVIWTQNAVTRLTEIEDFIAIDSSERAVSFVLELMDQADTLASFPDSGRIVPEDVEGRRRELIYQGYRIIYQVDKESVFILSVFEGSRLLRSDDLK
jgi:toxin ParE1/3/4